MDIDRYDKTYVLRCNLEEFLDIKVALISRVYTGIMLTADNEVPPLLKNTDNMVRRMTSWELEEIKRRTEE